MFQHIIKSSTFISKEKDRTYISDHGKCRCSVGMSVDGAVVCALARARDGDEDEN